MRLVCLTFATLLITILIIGLAAGYHYWNFSGLVTCIGEFFLLCGLQHMTCAIVNDTSHAKGKKG